MSRVRYCRSNTEGAVVPALGLGWLRPKRVYRQKKQPDFYLVVYWVVRLHYTETCARVRLATHLDSGPGLLTGFMLVILLSINVKGKKKNNHYLWLFSLVVSSLYSSDCVPNVVSNNTYPLLVHLQAPSLAISIFWNLTG